ncbi:MAG: YggS family pyridoxal phosphate-dependent enzyme [Gemmatimonadetes bacterium]|nr:YggS family pyridoxal phosphate-dependent enzyme [Gemmatimonadota bacterium]
MPRRRASAWRAGLRDCGENRVAELAEKHAAVRALRPAAADEICWHLIGHLQRNKVRKALPLTGLLHSVDSERLAAELSLEAERAGQALDILLEVNVSGETSKSGFAGGAGLLPAAARIAALPGLRVQGLMTMAPFTADARVLRATFREARALFERCGAEVPGFAAVHLSMGMSNDFEIAIEEGSTMVRLGTVLFGERQP